MLPTDSSPAVVVWRPYELVIPTAVVFGQLNTTAEMISPSKEISRLREKRSVRELSPWGERAMVQWMKCEQLLKLS